MTTKPSIPVATELAREAVERFRHWAFTVYPAHARAIADGLQLEWQAISAENALRRLERSAGVSPGELPPIPKAYASETDNLMAPYAAMVRLPNFEPGAAFFWPVGEVHPWWRLKFSPGKGP